MDRESLSEILFRRVYHRNATVALSSAVSSQTDATRLQSKTHPAHTPSYRYKLCAQRTFGRLLVRTSQLETNSHCHFRLLISGLSSALSAGTPRTIVTNELQFVTQLIPPPSSFDSWRRLNSITSEPPLLCLKTSPNSGSKAEKASGTSEIPIQNELRTFSETLCSTEAITRQISRQFLPFSVKTFTVGVITDKLSRITVIGRTIGYSPTDTFYRAEFTHKFSSDTLFEQAAIGSHKKQTENQEKDRPVETFQESWFKTPESWPIGRIHVYVLFDG